MTNIGGDEVFAIYHEGVALRLNWASVPPLDRSPVVRMRAIHAQQLLLVTADECMYSAQLDGSKTSIRLELQRSDVLDMDYCTVPRQLFIVTAGGTVLMQQLAELPQRSKSEWQLLSFDPLELSEQGISIHRVCCSAQGVLFVADGGAVYVMGTCGEIFSAETHPKRLRLFDEHKELLDVAAGDDFFIVLLKEKDMALERRGITRHNGVGATSSRLASTNTNPRQFPRDITTSSDYQKELNSTSSIRSYSSKSSSQSFGEHDLAANTRQILKHGYELLNTQVHTFGAINNGLLGTADHIKRPTINCLQKLEAVGVSNIAAGREHSLVRTLDGRLYHWGINSNQQLNTNKDVLDLSAPTELRLDGSSLNAKQRTVLEACCGDYHTVLINACGELYEKDKQLASMNKDLLTLQMGEACGKSLPLLLATGAFTLHNRRKFQTQHHACFSGLRAQLTVMLGHQQIIKRLQTIQQRNTATTAIMQLFQVCEIFQSLIFLLAALVKSLECFYRGDFCNPAELVFVKQYRECIELFEKYTKAYCDIYSIDGYVAAAKVLPGFPACSSNSAEQRQDINLEQLFQQPFQIFPYVIKFLDQLVKARPEFKEHLLAWQAYSSHNQIEVELAENTSDFWRQHERSSKISHFRRKHRRVLLNSATAPLKLAGNTISMSNTTFILFSDCLCQVGSQVHVFPLVAIWLKSEGDTAMRITTPERSFSLTARTLEIKKVWYSQLELSIIAALGNVHGDKAPTVRTTAYVFSRNHAKYGGAHAYGRWRNGLLHGNCYLEYPDGRFYFGMMRHGEIEGYGKMVIPSVGLYEGSFKAGKFHGYGNYEMKDNEIYEGNFRDGLFHGHGLLRNNNYTYVGEYRANAKSGYGILDDMVTGDKYMGMFADNKRTGAGTCITMNGDYFEGIFSNDELAGTGIAVFENDYYYEGELTMRGPNGKGTYYMPNGVADLNFEDLSNSDGRANKQLVGNVLSGQLSGNWQDVRVIAGSISINRQFGKYPKSIGELVVDNNRKWRFLFENFEEQILGDQTNKQNDTSGATSNATKTLWNRIAVFITTQREREKTLEQQDSTYKSSHSYFAKNISLGFSNSFDKISLKSTASLFTNAKSSILDVSGMLNEKRSHSQETLHDGEMTDFDCLNGSNPPNYCETEHPFSSINSIQNYSLGVWQTDSTASLRSSFDSVLNLTGSLNNNSFSSQTVLESVPGFGVSTLTEHDIAAIKEYLHQAFRDPHHPLYILNQRIATCFYTSYGCWKVKPTPILAKQAMREWESISKRVYKFVRKMFPALPEDYCVVESSREVISHITLLYPIVLSEGIYSTLFVLYANKYSCKDEMYRHNVMLAEKMHNKELAECLELDNSLLPIVNNPSFLQAIQTLKQLQEKFSPKAMLTVIENCMQQITDAHKIAVSENSVILAADSMMPLTLFLVLRAAVPHLGAELALLDDLTGGANFQFEMNGIAGYCYTTLKAAYEHIITKSLTSKC